MIEATTDTLRVIESIGSEFTIPTTDGGPPDLHLVIIEAPTAAELTQVDPGPSLAAVGRMNLLRRPRLEYSPIVPTIPYQRLIYFGDQDLLTRFLDASAKAVDALRQQDSDLDAHLGLPGDESFEHGIPNVWPLAIAGLLNQTGIGGVSRYRVGPPKAQGMRPVLAPERDEAAAEWAERLRAAGDRFVTIPPPDVVVTLFDSGVFEASADALGALWYRLRAKLGPIEWLDESHPGLPEHSLASEPTGMDDLVTLDQAASIVHRNKRTLERLKNKGLPNPVVEGGGGRTAYYDWKILGPYLRNEYHMVLPSVFPRLPRS